MINTTKTLINLGIVAPVGVGYGIIRDVDDIVSELEPDGVISTVVVTARDNSMKEMFKVSANLPKNMVSTAKEYWNEDKNNKKPRYEEKDFQK